MLPLEGMKVIDFSQGVAGPYSAMLMSDFGADVLKIEPLRGDWGRTLGTPMGEFESATYIAINRNKRSAALDLKHPDCRDVALALAAEADIVVHNYRPGVMQRLGLDYPTLATAKPDLIYCSVSGFGLEGPSVNYPSGDATMQAWGGLMSIVGGPEDDPTRVGNVVSDILTGMNVFQGALLAVLNRDRTGQGMELDVALLDSMIAFQAPAFAEYLVTGRPPPRTGNDHPLVAPSGLFKTLDSAIVFSALQHQWANFCKFFEVPELATDPAFATSAARVENRSALNAALRPLFATSTSEQALSRLRACDIQCAPVYDYAQVAADPQVQLNGLVGTREHPVLGQVPFVGNPVKLRGLPGKKGHAPMLGEHTDAVLEAAGWSPEKREAMRKAGAIK